MKRIILLLNCLFTVTLAASQSTDDEEKFKQALANAFIEAHESEGGKYPGTTDKLAITYIPDDDTYIMSFIATSGEPHNTPYQHTNYYTIDVHSPANRPYNPQNIPYTQFGTYDESRHAEIHRLNQMFETIIQHHDTPRDISTSQDSKTTDHAKSSQNQHIGSYQEMVGNKLTKYDERGKVIQITEYFNSDGTPIITNVNKNLSNKDKRKNISPDLMKMVAADFRRIMQGKTPEALVALQQTLHCDRNGDPIPGYQLEQQGPNFTYTKIPITEPSLHDFEAHTQQKTGVHKYKKMQEISATNMHAIHQELPEYKEISHLYKSYGLNDGDWFDRRNAVIEDMQQNGATYQMQLYEIPRSSRELLRKNGYEDTLYNQVYGNQLQQLVHQNCISLLEQTATIPTSSVVYAHKDTLVDFIDAARDYNQTGSTKQAIYVTNLCKSMLDYGTAILEGAVQGVIGVGTHCIDHPIQTALTVAAGEYMLAYQLSQVLFNVLDLGITKLFDTEQGAQKWNAYIEPVNKIIDAIKKGQVSSRDVVKGSTQFLVNWKAQGKVLNGLGKFYKTTKAKALDFIKEKPNALPEEYLATPEGFVFKAHAVAEDNKLPVHCTSGKTGGNNHGRNINKNQKKTHDSTNRTPNKNLIGYTYKNGKYDSVNYHHGNSVGNNKGGKSSGPKDGQLGLDNSLQIKTTAPRRIGVSEGQIIIFDRTSDGIFHGHVRTWTEIQSDPDMAKAVVEMIKAGLIDAKGKILK